MFLYIFRSHFYHFTPLPWISTLCPIYPLLPYSTFRYASPDHLTSLSDCTSLSDGRRCCIAIAGRNILRHILSESLLVSSIRVPNCFEDSEHCWYHQQLIFVFSIHCYILMAAPFYSALLPLHGHDSFFLLQIAQPCPFQFTLRPWMETSVEVDVLGTFPVVLWRCK